MGERRWTEEREAWKGIPDRYLTRHNVDAVILGPTPDADRLLRGLTERGWAAVHLDQAAAILVPRRPDTAALIEREGYSWMVTPERELLTTEHALEMLEEANRALRHCPDGVDTAWGYKADALRFLGFHDAAAEAGRRVVLE
jgi:hypothetical protein